MARTNITKQSASDSAFPWSTTGLVLTMTAADVANGNETTAVGKLMLIAHNTGASARTFTVTSTADTRLGRSGDVAAVSLAAGDLRMVLLVRDGWQYDDAGTMKYRFAANHAEVKFAVVELAG